MTNSNGSRFAEIPFNLVLAPPSRFCHIHEMQTPNSETWYSGLYTCLKLMQGEYIYIYIPVSGWDCQMGTLQMVGCPHRGSPFDETWVWLKINELGPTAGFSLRFHLAAILVSMFLSHIWLWLKIKLESKTQDLVHVSTCQGKPFWNSGFLSHSQLACRQRPVKTTPTKPPMVHGLPGTFSARGVANIGLHVRFRPLEKKQKQKNNIIPVVIDSLQNQRGKNRNQYS